MRDKLEKYIKQNFTSPSIWHYEEGETCCYIRFISMDKLYLATLFKISGHMEVFKLERNVLI